MHLLVLYERVNENGKGAERQEQRKNEMKEVTPPCSSTTSMNSNCTSQNSQAKNFFMIENLSVVLQSKAGDDGSNCRIVESISC